MKVKVSEKRSGLCFIRSISVVGTLLTHSKLHLHYHCSGHFADSRKSAHPLPLLGDSAKLFGRVTALCNLSRKKSREVAAHFRADF